jgi:DNA (cytosine-5)-methyltransferase 1
VKYLSVCSGIEAATVAWHPLGWQALGFSEIEKFPSEVLAHHYPDVPNLGDMTKFKEWNFESDVDVFVGGTPCQSFSVAGLRKGLDDPRGNLMLTYLAIADKFRPRWLVWENVPGVLSSNNGKDFGTFLGGLGELGYGFAYRILDAQYFGVAQRRRRVFVVGYLGDWRRAAAVLFERHSLQGDFAPSRQAGQSFTASTKPSLDSEGLQLTVGALCADTHHGAYSGQDAYTGRLIPQVVGAIDCRIDAQRAQNAQAGHMLPVFYDIKQHHNPQPTKTVQLTSNNCTFVRGDTPLVQPIPIHDQATRHAGKNGEKTMGKGNGLGIGQPGEPMNTLTKGDRHAVAHPITFSSVLSNQPINSKIEVSQTLEAKNPMAVAFNIAPGKGKLKDDIHVTDAHTSKTIDASGSNPCMHQGGAAIVQPVGVDIFNAAFSGEVAVPLTNRSDGTGTGPTVMQSMAVRRLTCTECERLQGFPDGYTNIPWRKADESPDGPRYKALGNSMAVPVMAWIGKRIQEIESL